MRTAVNLDFLGTGDKDELITPERLLKDFQAIARKINQAGDINRYLQTSHGWLNGTICIKIHEEPLKRDHTVHQLVKNVIQITITKKDSEPHGKVYVEKIEPSVQQAQETQEKHHPASLAVKVLPRKSGSDSDKVLPKAWANINFRSLQILQKYAGKEATTDDMNRMLLANEVWLEGNMAFFSCFNYLLSLLTPGKTEANSPQPASPAEVSCQGNHKPTGGDNPGRNMRKERLAGRLKAERRFGCLDDPYLQAYSLSDFERLKAFKQDRLDTKNNMPEITAEQGQLLTEYFVKNGYETRADGSFVNPDKSMSEAYHYMMTHKKTILRKNDLLAGTMTPNPICGSVTQPYTIGWGIWGEMKTIATRELEPYQVSAETEKTLHQDVFPFWMDRNILEVWKKKYQYSKAAEINDRFFCLNLWGLVSLSPGSPNFDNILKKGIKGLLEEIEANQSHIVVTEEEEEARQNTLGAMKTSLEGILIYTQRLAAQVKQEYQREENPKRKKELDNIHNILLHVPANPARNLHEAVQSIWIMFIGVGLDSMDDNVALGRLDQLLQPYFAAGIEGKNQAERQAYIKESIELVGCLFMRITSHLIAAPLLSTWQNSAGPGTASTTVGGITPDGTDAVNEMTYIILKVVEMLCMDDPDMDARYYPGINDTMYLKRVCEVNYITSGTPSIHGDSAVIESLTKANPDWKIEDIRDWVPCGCVEPVIMGKHFAATGDIDSNLMVSLALALNDGYEPVAEWDMGCKSGKLKDFTSFDQFFNAFKKQYHYLYDTIITASRHLVKVQQEVMPAPIYSALLEGCIEKGVGMTHGGAQYNSSGGAFIALSDVIDSLLVIKQLVFDEKKITFPELKDAIDNNFAHRAQIHHLVLKDVAKFGSGHNAGRLMAKRVTEMIAGFLQPLDNGRGGHYAPGYRTNNNHTVYGMVSGASPSGRKYGQPFTSGLTPCKDATKNLLDVLNDVAAIPPETANNSYTLNVRLSFRKNDTYQQRIDHIANYVETYCVSGGMQVQFNMVDAETLWDAMANPEYYPDLIARVSGYTGFYTRMMPALQTEIINRAEFDI